MSIRDLIDKIENPDDKKAYRQFYECSHDERAAFLRKRWGKIWNLVERRRYITPHGYPSNAYPIQWICMCISRMQKLDGDGLANKTVSANEHDGSICAEAGVGYKILDHDAPTFFVNRDWLNAVAESNVPDDISYTDIHFPHDGMIVTLPNGWAEKRYGLNVTHLLYGRMRAEERLPSDKGIEILEAMRIMLEMPRKLNEFANVDDAVVITALVDKRNLIESSYNSLSFSAKTTTTNMKKWGTDEVLSQEAQKMYQIICRLGTGIILAMTAAPEHVLTGGMARPEKVKHGRVRVGLWHPNWIGRDYRIKNEGLPVGSHASPRMHWRKGHFRQQHFGFHNLKVRTIWIEPVLVNASKED